MPSFRSGQEPIVFADDGRDLWERQPGEGAAPFRHFQAYLNLGGARRLVEVSRKLEMNDSHIRALARHFRWAERADAYDRDVELKFIEKMADDRRSVALVHLAMGTTVFAKVRERMSTLDAQTLSPQQLVRLMEVALKLQTSALGIPDTTVKLTGDPEQPVAVVSADGMSLAERRGLLDKVVEEMQRRRAGGQGGA